MTLGSNRRCAGRRTSSRAAAALRYQSKRKAISIIFLTPCVPVFIRVVQESLTNCARHAEARNVRITVMGSKDRINLKIQDDGKGFNRNEISSPGLGLIGMEERIKKLGGTLAISSRRGKP